MPADDAKPRRANRVQRARRAALAIGLGAALWCTGCEDLSGIDRRVNNLLESSAANIDGGAVAPKREWPPLDSLETPDQADTDPPTLNPPADKLRYGLAAEDRNVAQRLDEYTALPADATPITLADSFRIAQQTAREYKTAEEDYILSAIRLLIERHRWGPRFFDDITSSVDGQFGDDGESALRVINELRATQRLPYGGEVEARLVTEWTEQLRSSVTEDYTQSNALILSGTVPLLRDAGLIAREDLIQAERNLVYAARDFEDFRRTFFVDIARDFFDLVAQKSSILNLERSLESRRQSFERAKARVAAGKDPASSARQLEQDVLGTESDLVNARESYILALDRFKIRLGIDVNQPIDVVSETLNLPEPATTPIEAAELALLYRLDLQNTRDRINDSRRAVANARNQLLPDLDLAGSVTAGTPEDERVGGFDLRFDEAEYFASVTFGLPLDREIERLNVRSAVISLERQLREYERFRDSVILEARAQRRAIEQQRLNLVLAERQVETNELRLEELKIKEEAANLISDANDDVLEASDRRDAAVRDLRTAVADYLRATGILRVRPDGSFQPLPGMAQYEEQMRQGADQPPAVEPGAEPPTQDQPPAQNPDDLVPATEDENLAPPPPQPDQP